VTRRTLSIVAGLFLVGFSLSVFWMAREIFRVSRIQRIPADDRVPAAQTNAPAARP
jgi:hypothetical protein